MYLEGHDDKILNDVTLLACKAACVLEESFSCKSIEYSAQDKTCRLSRESTESAPSHVKKIFGSQIKYEMYDHLCRTGMYEIYQYYKIESYFRYNSIVYICVILLI